MLVKNLVEVNAIFDRIEAEHSRPRKESVPEIYDDKYREIVAISNEMATLPSVIYELEDAGLPKGRLASLRDRLKALGDSIIKEAHRVPKYKRADPIRLVASYCRRGATMKEVAEKYGTDLNGVVAALKEFPQIRKHELKKTRQLAAGR